jgi:hypothetical protein
MPKATNKIFFKKKGINNESYAKEAGKGGGSIAPPFVSIVILNNIDDILHP